MPGDQSRQMTLNEPAFSRVKLAFSITILDIEALLTLQERVNR